MIELTRRKWTLRNVDLLRNSNKTRERSWRNFKGEAGMRNAAGNRNFTIGLDDETAAEMKAAGWPVRSRPDNRQGHEGEERHTLKVGVKYRTRDGREMKPPEITVITGKNHVKYGEDQIEALDFMEFSNVDLILSAYPTVNSFTGEDAVGVSLSVMFATVEEDEDELTREYNARWDNDENDGELPF